MKTNRKCWIRKGVIFVPHQTKQKTWVGPGYGRKNFKEYSETNMRALNAIDLKYLLFPVAEVN